MMMVTPDELRRSAARRRDAARDEADARRRAAAASRRAEHERFCQLEIDPDRFLRDVAGQLELAVARGESRLVLLRFRSDFCTDGGRAINNLDAGWPATLTGGAKRVHEVHRAHLVPLGYGLEAVIADFPGGMPGDVHLVLTW